MRQTRLAFVLLAAVVITAGAQSSADQNSSAQETQVRGYWTDPATGLMWAAKDNGKDVNWHNAVKYCSDLRLSGDADWRLPNLEELKTIFDRNVSTLGSVGPDKGRAYAWHVKGNLFLTGVEWSTTQRVDDRGQPNGLVWYFDFNNGIQKDDDSGRISGRFSKYARRALCVRGSGK